MSRAIESNQSWALYYALLSATRAAESHLSEVGGPNMSAREMAVLAYVAGHEGTNQQSVAEALGVNRNSMVSVLDSLESRKYVLRQKNHLNRREHKLVLTTGGKEVAEGLFNRITFGKSLSIDQRQLIIEWLLRITESSGLKN